jgi:hypothetical protein
MCPTNSLCGAPLHDNNAPRATAPRPALRVHALHLRMKARLLRDLGSAECSCVTASPEGPTPQLGFYAGTSKARQKPRSAMGSPAPGDTNPSRYVHEIARCAISYSAR